MIEKNDIFTAVTEAIGSNGEGIIRHEGITFFVPACLPGERVTVKVLKNFFDLEREQMSIQGTKYEVTRSRAKYLEGLNLVETME